MSHNFNSLSKQGFYDGLRHSIGISFAGGLFAFVFGVLAMHSGLSLAHGMFLSTTVFAGALQMISLHLWGMQPIPIFTIITLSFVVCARYILMGMVLRPKLEQANPYAVYTTLFFVADENWALTFLRSRKQSDPHYLQRYLLSSGLNFYFFWVLGTLAGMLVGQYIDHPEYLALDFAFVAIFLALLVGIWHGKHDMFPWAVAAIAAFIASYFVTGQWYIVIGALIGSLSGVMRDVLVA